MDLFNSLVRKNEELISYDFNLTRLQHIVIEHLVMSFQLSESSFFNDSELFKDLCLAFKGNILITRQPFTWVPVIESKLL